MSDSKKRSLFQISGLPEAFGVIVLTLALVIALSPYLAGKTIANLTFPNFGPTATAILKILGPLFFVVLVLAFLPVWPIRRGKSGSVSPDHSNEQEGVGKPDSFVNAASTCVIGNTIHLFIARNGDIVGGADAMRRVAIPLLNSDWDGKFHIRHKYYEETVNELNALLTMTQLSDEQVKQAEKLQARQRYLSTSFRNIELTLRLSFFGVNYRRRFWGVPLSNARIVGFIENLLIEMLPALAPSPYERSIKCQLYVPGHKGNPIGANVRFSEDEALTYTESWVQELQRHAKIPWSAWDWDQLIPVWKFDDDFIATRLLPHIALDLVLRVIDAEVNNPESYLSKLSEMFTETERNPMSPYNWVVAVGSERSYKDLAWLVSPPAERHKLQELP